MNKWLNRKFDEKKRTGKGFTLIELLVVITVLGILAAIVAYAVQNITGQAQTAAGGTSQSEISQAEQQYCAQNGKYGTVPDLVNAGLLTNPAPDLTIYVSSVPGNAQMYAGCSAASAGQSSISTNGTATGATSSGTVYDVFPQTITQPDGSIANIPTPPTNVVVVDDAGPPAEELAALGVVAYGGNNENYSTGSADAALYGVQNINPLVNTNNYVTFGIGTNNPNFQEIAAAKPGLIVGDRGLETSSDTSSALEAIAPVVSLSSFTTPTAPVVPGQSLTQPTAGDPAYLGWYQQLVLLGQVLNRQAEAAAFITAFENAAASIIPKMQGKTVSWITPTQNKDDIRVLTPLTSYYAAYLGFLGLTFAPCPASLSADGCDGNGDGGGEIPIATAEGPDGPQLFSGQYLMLNSTNDATETFDIGLLTGGLATLPQVTNSTPGCWSGGSAPGYSTAAAPCYVVGPAQDPAYGPPAGTGTLTGRGPATINWASITSNPLTGYCSTAGVSAVADATAAVINNGSQVTTTACPGYAANSAVAYTPQTLTNGIFAFGPITGLAAMTTDPATSDQWISEDFGA